MDITIRCSSCGTDIDRWSKTYCESCIEEVSEANKILLKDLGTVQKELDYLNEFIDDRDLWSKLDAWKVAHAL